MLTVYQRSITYRKPRQVEKFQKGAWMHLESPTEAELEEAARTLGVELDTLKDALDPHEAPRLEAEKEGVYTFIRYPHGETTVPLLVVVATDGLLTVSQVESPLIERFEGGAVNFYTTQKARFVLLVLSEATRRYTSAMSAIRKEVNRSKTRPDRMTSKDIVKFVAYESTVSDYLDALVPLQAILNKILTGKTKVLDIREEDKDLAEDLILSTNQLIEAARSSVKAMVNIRSAYTAISTDRLNRILRTLTAITVILTIPLGITSFYGMNIVLPAAEYSHAASVIAFTIVLLSAGLLALFIKNKWL
ncbi:MAG: magnesium transporter CorA family protein [Candidatus Paceibacteria bacterium]